MIEFIYGDPGTGKTEYILKALEKDSASKTPAILIVPEQMTVYAERQVLLRLPPSAQMHTEVLNFSRLANRVFREHGGIAYNNASNALRKLIMWRAVNIAAPFLSEYARHNNDDCALADAMCGTLKELTASGISPEQLEKIAQEMTDSPLSRKIRDIATVSSIYYSLLGDNYSDQSTDLVRLCETLEKQNFFAGMNIYIDGFSSLTGQEHAIVKHIMRQANKLCITVALPAPNTRNIDSHSLRSYSDRLRRDTASLGITCKTVRLQTNHRSKNEELRFMTKNLWKLNSSEKAVTEDSERGNVELWRAADIYDECEAVSARVRELLESGYRCRDIVIIARNADKYKGIIEPAFDCMDIPYFISEKTDTSLCPVARLILSALRIANFGWRREDVISHLKTGLCGIAPRDADVFEAYTFKWNISGKRFTDQSSWNMNPDGYTTHHSARGDEILDIANKVKSILVPRLQRYISELRAAESCSGMCVATVNYLEELDIRSSLRELVTREIAVGRMREASETARMYDAILEALDCVCDAFEDAPKPDLPTFSTSIRTVLEENEIGTIPTSPDEVVIGSANMLRAGEAKCVFLIGVCDGEFPANTQSTGLFTDTERDFLIEHDLPLEGDRERRAADELFFFRRAASSPTDKLIVFTRADSEPSIAFSRIQSIFPYLCVNETSSDILRNIRTYRSASEYLPLLEGREMGAALRILLEENADRYDFISATTSDHPISAANDKIDPDIASNIFGKEIRLSQSRIEKFMGCRFAYVCKYLLELDEGRRAEFAFDSIGTFVHHILEKFLYAVYVTGDGSIPETNRKEKLLDTIIKDYIDTLLPEEDGKKSARLLHMTERLRKLSYLVIDDLLAEFSDSEFRPEFFELHIGSGGIPSVNFRLNDGTKVSLSGVVDRIDVFRKDGKVFLRVVDYKTGDKTFSISDISEGLNLQLLLYIFSLTKIAGTEFTAALGGKPTAAAITYISTIPTKVNMVRMDSEKEAGKATVQAIKRSGLILDDPDVIEAISRSGNSRYLMSTSRKTSMISEEGFNQLYRDVEAILYKVGTEMTSGRAEAAPNSDKDRCGYCQFSNICRAAKRKK